MDFSFSEEQAAVVEAARQLFNGHLTDARRTEVESTDDGYDWSLWKGLAAANLLGLAVGTDEGGSGFGFGEISVLLEEAGRAAAPVPLWASLVLGGLPVARFGSAELRAELLSPMAAGDKVLTAALVEPGTDPLNPTTVARRTASGWEIRGSKTAVPAGTVAGAILVPAKTDQGETVVLVVDPSADGVEVARLETTTGIPEAHLELAGAVVDEARLLGGAEVLSWLLPRATVGLCSLMAGTCRSAVALTSEYARSRQQFGRVIASFQAVGQRAAEAYIDGEAVELTSRQAAWRLAEDRPADEQVAIAKFWAAEGGQRVVHAAQHLHGGVGVDRTYPLHRYFLAAKQYELTLGGATTSLVRLGALIAAGEA